MQTSFKSILLEQLGLHPGFTVEDLYKLIYQAVFGLEHLFSDEKGAYRALCEELEGLTQPLSGEKLLELIDPKGIIYRMNLRPYKTKRGNLDRLFKVLLLTKRRVSGTRMDFLSLWEEAKKLIKKLSLPFSLEHMKKLEFSFLNGDLPILHHSKSYERLNHPSYRLVATEYIEIIFEK